MSPWFSSTRKNTRSFFGRHPLSRTQVNRLEKVARELTNGATLLRIYWYDGLLHGRRSVQQEALAIADNLKVRLGTVTAGRQKGVDSLIVTDLIELARNHAISDAVLLSGDEDLRIGVQIAQSFGVRVHLLGIEPSRGNQSNFLREEADTTSEWGKEDIQEILSVKSVRSPSSETSSKHVGNADSDAENSNLLNDVAMQAVNSINENELPSVAEQLTQSPGLIPHDYDSRLLVEAGKKLGRDLAQPESRRIRDKFRELIKARTQDHLSEHASGCTP